MRAYFRLAAFLLLFALPLSAGEMPTWKVPRLSGDVKADGAMHEPQWEKAFSWQGFVEVNLREKAAPSRQTQLLLFTTDWALVIGLRCQDPSPGEIRRQRMGRDEGGGVDVVGILLDPTGEAKQALYLGLSVAGDVNDGFIDLALGALSLSYDALFSHGARLASTGWEAELVIPFTSLSFAPKGDNRMLLGVSRLVPRGDFEVLSLLPVDRASQDPRGGWPTFWWIPRGFKLLAAGT